jgi:signal transduction histidine kinase
VHGTVVGVLHVDSRVPRRFAEDDVRLLELVAGRVALVIERSRLADAERRARADAERMKDDLTHMVIHDLKNPLNGIAMMVQLALRKGGAAMPESQQNYLRQIDRTCREMMRLVMNLLDISKIEAGKMPVAHEAITLAALADEIAEEYAPVAGEVGRRLVVTVAPALPTAVGDRALLKRVLVNLVVNALRHSGSPEVHIEATPDGSTEVALRVIDRGRGIAPDEQARLFEKFRSVRSDPSADTGLGLPFCKLAVERMGGRIGVTSEPGAGTTFAVMLPADPGPA